MKNLNELEYDRLLKRRDLYAKRLSDIDFELKYRDIMELKAMKNEFPALMESMNLDVDKISTCNKMIAMVPLGWSGIPLDPIGTLDDLRGNKDAS